MDTEKVIAYLKLNNYCLVTDDDDEPNYDENGRLLVCKPENGDLVAVPDVNPIRKLYDLPELSGESIRVTKTVRGLNTTTLGELSDVNDASHHVIWMGQRSQQCKEATELLIKLVGSEKYKKLMTDRSIVKLKIWELIGEEIESNGYKIGHNRKEIALKTFQKWRNLERTYWKFMKVTNEDDLWKRKPFIWDSMHDILSKRDDYDKKCGSLFEKKAESPPKAAIRLLVSLASKKYKFLLNGPKFKGVGKKWMASLQLWERIYDEIDARGYGFSATRREGAVRLRGHWMKNINILKRHRRPKESKASSTSLGNINQCEFKNTDSLTPDETSDNGTKSNIQGGCVAALLELLNSEKYTNLSQNNNYKCNSLWAKVYYELESMGFCIPGPTLRAKSKKLFLKWKSLKHSLIKYEVAKSKGLILEKPAHYDLLLNIVYREVISKSEIKSPSFVDATLDHDYVQPPLDMVPLDIMTTKPTAPVSADPLCTTVSHAACQTTFTSLEEKCTRNEDSAIYDALVQMTAAQEASLSAQNDKFEQMISLLNQQINYQQELNGLVSKYIIDTAVKKAIHRRNKSELKSQMLSSHFNSG